MKFAVIFATLVALFHVVISDEGKKRVRIQRYVKKSDNEISAAPSQPQTEDQNKKKIRIRQYIKRYDAKTQSNLQLPVSELTDDIKDEQKSQEASNEEKVEKSQEASNEGKLEKSHELLNKESKEESNETSHMEKKEESDENSHTEKNEESHEVPNTEKKESHGVPVEQSDETSNAEKTEKSPVTEISQTAATEDPINDQPTEKKRVRIKRYVKKKKENVNAETSNQEPSKDEEGLSNNKNAETEKKDDKDKGIEQNENSKKDENNMSALTVDTSKLSTIQNDDRKRIRVDKNYKKYSSTQQLSIESPTSDDTLTANTTSTVYVTSTPTKSFKQAQQEIATFIFACATGTFTVEAPVGVPTEYVVDPDVGGECQVVAKVLNNPDFLESPPVFPKVLIPIYFEGTRGTEFFTGEKISIFLRPSNNAILSIDFLIQCGALRKVIPIVTTVKPIDFFLPPFFLGQCEFSSITDLPDYVPFPKINVNISPAIFFLRPGPNTVIQPGENILVNLISTNLISDLTVTVELTCNDVFVTTLTQDIQSTYTFVPSADIYGSCVLSMGEVDGYFTEQTIPIVVLKALSFAEPEPFALIPPNTDYNIQVTGNVPEGSVDVTVVGTCQSGRSFTVNLPIGQSRTFRMGSEILGFCTLTASAPDFVDAFTQVQVFTPLTPEQIKAVALSLKLDGGIVATTEN